MADLEVTCTCKDDEGDILCLGGAFGQVDKDDAIEEIESGTNRYWVPGKGGGKVDVHVVPGHKPPYLRTDPDGDPENNLDELPDC
ncbi:MAG: DUF3892 domain-containing protein [Acidimicrobiia bacterium]|nr:DUF3892 domain-containing protein [Acidimicrobiia bacterium]